LPLRIYDTMSREKRVFKPLRDNRVYMFVCGPTVYDLSHIGHARTYVAYDVIARFLKALGYSVFFLMNITDVDDKIIKRANELGVSPLKLSSDMTREFFKDMESLNVTTVNLYAKASEHIEEIIDQIKVLLSKGYAYTAEGDVYFDVSKFPDYGKLSRQKLEELKVHRVEPNPKKRNPGDFALWKKRKPGEPYWTSPWGEGRPGWHIEDTAITYTYFGPQYDIHGGAVELVFPHHEAEIAQGEAASGVKPMVNFWVHTGVLKIRGEKMSKSLGNYVTIREALKFCDPNALRLFFTLSHYRSPIDYTREKVENAKKTFEDLVRAYTKALKAVKNVKVWGENQGVNVEEARRSFYEAMEDDFNTPKAVSTLLELAGKIESLKPNKTRRETFEEALKFMEEAFSILGLRVTQGKSEETLNKLLDLILEVREELRRRGEWKLSDLIRSRLSDLGFKVEDTPQGPVWIEKPR